MPNRATRKDWLVEAITSWGNYIVHVIVKTGYVVSGRGVCIDLAVIGRGGESVGLL